MNRHAKQLGMTDSHFVNSTGLPDPNHYTSAADIAKNNMQDIANELGHTKVAVNFVWTLVAAFLVGRYRLAGAIACLGQAQNLLLVLAGLFIVVVQGGLIGRWSKKYGDRWLVMLGFTCAVFIAGKDQFKGLKDGLGDKIGMIIADKSYEVYLALYQAVTGTEEEKNVYKQFSPDFFDLVVTVANEGFLPTALLPHGVSFRDPRLIIASLDHTLWLHRPFRADEWLLYATDSPWKPKRRTASPASDCDRRNRCRTPRRSPERRPGRRRCRPAAPSALRHRNRLPPPVLQLCRPAPRQTPRWPA